MAVKGVSITILHCPMFCLEPLSTPVPHTAVKISGFWGCLNCPKVEPRSDHATALRDGGLSTAANNFVLLHNPLPMEVPILVDVSLFLGYPKDTPVLFKRIIPWMQHMHG